MQEFAANALKIALIAAVIAGIGLGLVMVFFADPLAW